MVYRIILSSIKGLHFSVFYIAIVSFLGMILLVIELEICIATCINNYNGICHAISIVEI